MRFVQQTTIARDTQIEGVALHSGALVRVILRSAAAGQGVVFRRSGGTDITASPDAVGDTHFNTGVGRGPTRVATVEHLMAAIALAQVDNVLIEIDGPELPALDGSAAPWLTLMTEAGLRTLNAPREALRIMAPVTMEDAGGRSIRAEPFDGRVIEVSIDFADAAIGAQRVTLDLDNAHDVKRVAVARTFCRHEDIGRMRAKGLSLGGTLENAVVIDGARVLNPSGLRDSHEFALHKALDLIGDLRLVGAPVIGRICAHRPGHDLNTRFAAALLASGDRVTRAPEVSNPARARA